ncbi:hypothetical protein KAW96_03835 [candidate division WOR-3 bacterium]|nr:hypothetical protein [candidate division WOR-3 bacterium]
MNQSVGRKERADDRISEYQKRMNQMNKMKEINIQNDINDRKIEKE